MKLLLIYDVLKIVHHVIEFQHTDKPISLCQMAIFSVFHLIFCVISFKPLKLLLLINAQCNRNATILNLEEVSSR